MSQHEPASVDQAAPVLEAHLGRKDGLRPLRFLAEGLAVAKCVALIRLPDGSTGSGFLLPGDWLLTNHHVLPTHAAAAEAVALFGFELGADGFYRSGEQFKLAPALGFHTSPTKGGDDWTAVKLAQPANAQFGALVLSPDLPAVGDALEIIQHPAGGHQQIAMLEESVVELPPRRVRYLNPTLPGSSGAPVFNARWQVVALHQGEAEGVDADGNPRRCNQGIHVSALAEGLSAAGVWPPQLARPAIVHDTGPMALDSPWYVVREADRMALRHFKNGGVTVALRGGPNIGKSSLANRLQAALEADGWRSASVDLGNEFTADDYRDGHSLLRALALKIVEQTSAPLAALDTFQRDNTPTAFKAFLFRLWPPERPQRLLLTLDRIDALAGTPCCAAVLSGLRVLHNDQNKMGGKHHVKMLLLHTIRPQQDDPTGSVFDVARQVDVDDFGRDTLAALVALYGLPPVDVPRLHEMLGGHPLLSRMALNAMAEESLALEDLLSEAALRDGGIFKMHLQHVQNQFKAKPDRGRAAANGFRTLLAGGELPDDACFEALLGLGVVRGSYSGDAVVRCGLYASFLPPRLAR